MTSPEPFSSVLQSERDLDVLGCVLLQTSPEALRSLRERLWWLPNVTDLGPIEAVSSIRLALKSFSSYNERMAHMAWLYCCLAELNLLKPWKLYTVRPAAVPLTGRFVLHERLSSALYYPGGHTLSGKIENNDQIFACVLATHRKRKSPEHDVICLSVNRHKPQLYVRVVRHESRVMAALQSILRGSGAQMVPGQLGELRFAFEDADTKPLDSTDSQVANSGSGNSSSPSKGPDQTVDTGCFARK
ncbi:hypothetical protein HPB50_008267 [Hyalomma asiaticum]|uniref:Uncharacterized protein n=1 Tax=Hyalomma asiaticum TaxID=266040 RepID=A0ACB7RMY6_HYAAI|nr:hypothetical protein HPB50_008267 [Hyalomma asiaticum]